MNISECKEQYVLPKTGTRVKTVMNENECTDGFLVNKKYIETRKNDVGFYKDYVPGAGGDIWWIEHDDGTVAAYAFDEVFDEE